MKGDVLFKIAGVLVLLMSVALFVIIFLVILVGLPGWVCAGYGILYCIAAGYIAKTFIVPKLEEKKEDTKEE